MKRKKKERLHYELREIEETYGGTLDWLELGELRSFVEAGNSPYQNPEGITHEDGTPLNFVEWHREARWRDATEPSEKELFDRYTNRRFTLASLEETQKFLREAQTYLGCEILALMDFLREKGLLYEYLRHKYPASLVEEEELPF